MTSTSNRSGRVPWKTVSPYPFIPSLISPTEIVAGLASPRASGIDRPQPGGEAGQRRDRDERRERLCFCTRAIIRGSPAS